MAKKISKDEYIKDMEYDSLTKLENHAWYGLERVLGKEFCKTGFFKPYWPDIKKGKLFEMTVKGVDIKISKETGVYIKRTGNADTDVVEHAITSQAEQVKKTPEKAEKTPKKSKPGGNTKTAVKFDINNVKFKDIKESGVGNVCEVRYYIEGRQLGYLKTTRDNDETVSNGIEICKQANAHPSQMTIYKWWEEEDAVGKVEDYL